VVSGNIAIFQHGLLLLYYVSPVLQKKLEAELLAKYESDIKNENRLIETRYKKLNIDETLEDYLDANRADTSLCLYYSKMSFLSGNTELALNTLSQSLEYNNTNQVLWLEYLNIYSVSTHKDYHELCFLAIDNSPTYDIFWKVIHAVHF
jgi:hypothetical protein